MYYILCLKDNIYYILDQNRFFCGVYNNYQSAFMVCQQLNRGMLPMTNPYFNPYYQNSFFGQQAPLINNSLYNNMNQMNGLPQNLMEPDIFSQNSSLQYQGNYPYMNSFNKEVFKPNTQQNQKDNSADFINKSDLVNNDQKYKTNNNINDNISFNINANENKNENNLIKESQKTTLTNQENSTKSLNNIQNEESEINDNLELNKESDNDKVVIIDKSIVNKYEYDDETIYDEPIEVEKELVFQDGEDNIEDWNINTKKVKSFIDKFS
ncbi:hypothetical protein [Spiroplasma tabanidicola]|uniref:Uncharacterized protein n=1 Tax=Spiroplasma tabanidicola TaxID=324079 RepID=A0A6I6CDM9_9MOLU|nr:hypothetical protein [Spiroplasma tabanidicola]QGS52222.1 hypothetical protein STABA_v1c08670 [Spiroplasma tabanidicola]